MEGIWQVQQGEPGQLQWGCRGGLPEAASTGQPEWGKDHHGGRRRWGWASGQERRQEWDGEEDLPCLACKWILNSLGNKDPICLIENVPYVPAFAHAFSFLSWRVQLWGDSLVNCKNRGWGKCQIGHWRNVYVDDTEEQKWLGIIGPQLTSLPAQSPHVTAEVRLLRQGFSLGIGAVANLRRFNECCGETVESTSPKESGTRASKSWPLGQGLTAYLVWCSHSILQWLVLLERGAAVKGILVPVIYSLSFSIHRMGSRYNLFTPFLLKRSWKAHLESFSTTHLCGITCAASGCSVPPKRAHEEMTRLFKILFI